MIGAVWRLSGLRGDYRAERRCPALHAAHDHDLKRLLLFEAGMVNFVRFPCLPLVHVTVESRPFMILLILRSLRPRQWTKNIVVYAALIFAQRLFVVPDFWRVSAAFVLFCLVSGAVYLINDVLDREEDARHPRKKFRPVASGALAAPAALVAAGVLIVIGVGGALALDRVLGGWVLVYVLLQGAYSLWLKRLVILDLFVIAVGFVIRAVAGAVVIGVEISSWLLVCTILLSLFLALCKRRAELVQLADGAAQTRKILSRYSLGFLDQMISIVASASVVSYSLYTMSAETVAKFGTTDLKYTIPLVLYGIFRYLYLVHQEREGDAPELVLLTDGPLLGNLVVFALTAGWILYH